MSTVHDLKCWPGPFQALVDGVKTAEWRECRDRDFKEGDTLHMREWKPYPDPEAVVDPAALYTGREVDLLVTHIIRGPAYGIPEGYCMMSVRRVNSIEAAAPDMLDALERVPAALMDIQGIMRKHGLKLDDLNDPMQKLAFTIYSTLAELDMHARAAIAKASGQGE